MTDVSPRSFAGRLAFAYAAAAVALMLLIGTASTLFTMRLYARTMNDVIVSAARAVEMRVGRYDANRIPATRYVALLNADLGLPHVRIAVFDDHHHRISESEPLRPASGLTDAVASLLHLQPVRIPIAGGFVTVSANVDQVEDALHAYYALMAPVCVVAAILAWIAGWLITRRAVAPLRTIAAAMRRFARGDFQAVPLRAGSNDEIGDLAHSYNAALHHLRSAFAQRDRSEAEIRQFIADAGHELRTPLTVIMGYLDALEHGAVDAPGVRERVFGTLRQESRRMRLLIEKLIYLARLERGEPAAREVVDVAAIVAGVVRSVEPKHAATVEVSAITNASIVADRGEIAEAIRNLIDNAVKYAPGAPVYVGMNVDAADVVITVHDDGPGIPVADQPHVFDRFYRGHANREVEGTGLGLAIVKRAVYRYGGTIVLESRAGAGTTFTLRFPRASGCASA